MILNGEEYSKRLESFSHDTMLLMSKVFKRTKEGALKAMEMASDTEVTEEQLVAAMKQLLGEKDS